MNQNIAFGTPTHAPTNTTAYVAPDAPAGELQIIWAELSRYENVVTSLVERLNPILRPEYAGPEQSISEPHQLESEIASVRGVLAASTSRLVALLDRVDL